MQSISGRTYEIDKKLGSGTYGTVFSVKRDDNQEFAFKKYDNSTQDIDLGALREVSILKLFQAFPNNGIIHLEDIILHEDNNDYTFGIIMKKYSTDLFEAIKHKMLTKKHRRKIAKKMLKAVVFLHDNGIIHRDIKPENILLDENMVPVLADFTLSKVFNDDSCIEETHTSVIATSTYRSPEVFAKKKYGFPADYWSLGVVFYEMFTKKQLTFDKDKDAIAFLTMRAQQFKSSPLGDMIGGFLKVKPEERWTARDALESDIFNINLPNMKVWSHSKPYSVSKQINEISDNFEAEKNITRYAAQIYLSKTECSPYSAVELACKFYETELYEFENKDYPEDELLILHKMNYNLII
jgi:serine/threonine protein kinase